jgi:hypothetical protein
MSDGFDVTALREWLLREGCGALYCHPIFALSKRASRNDGLGIFGWYIWEEHAQGFNDVNEGEVRFTVLT